MILKSILKNTLQKFISLIFFFLKSRTLFDELISKTENYYRLKNRISLDKINENKILKNKSINLVDVGASFDIQDFSKKYEKIINFHLIDCNWDNSIFPKRKNFHFYDKYISDKKKIISFNLTNDSGLSSGLMPNAEMSDYYWNKQNQNTVKIKKKIKLTSTTLKDLLKVNSIDILKIDVQGTEFEVLKGMGKYRPFLIKVESSTSEMYKNQKTIFEIGTLLRSKGYILHTSSFFSKPTPVNLKWKNIVNLHGDFIFVPNHVGEGKKIIMKNLEKYFISYAIYGIQDFALYQLTQLKINKKKIIDLIEFIKKEG